MPNLYVFVCLCTCTLAQINASNNWSSAANCITFIGNSKCSADTAAVSQLTGNILSLLQNLNRFIAGCVGTHRTMGFRWLSCIPWCQNPPHASLNLVLRLGSLVQFLLQQSFCLIWGQEREAAGCQWGLVCRAANHMFESRADFNYSLGADGDQFSSPSNRTRQFVIACNCRRKKNFRSGKYSKPDVLSETREHGASFQTHMWL